MFHRANVQSDLYSGALVKDVNAMLVLNSFLGVYSGKVESSAVLYQSLRYL